MTDDVLYSALHWAKKAEYWAGQAAQGQIQSDWAQTDNTKKDFIKNKPGINDLLPSQTGQSGKFLTTNGSAASWASVDALPSQASQSGKFLTTNGTTASWGVPKTHDLFDNKWEDYLLNDQNWLRADTFSWQDGTVYSDAYNHLVDDRTDGVSAYDTVAGIRVYYYLADDGHKICGPSQETAIQDIYNATGVAWYYILDPTNQRFKLPRTKYGFVGLRDTVGNYVPESLPNITGGGVLTSISSKSGATQDIVKQTTSGIGDGSWWNTGVGAGTFDASDSSSTYQNNAPVQQRATQMYLYFYVGQYNQSATEQTAGLNAELFNGKIDRDMSNMNPSQTAKETIVGWGLPDLTTGVSQSSSGFTSTKKQWIRANVHSQGYDAKIYVNGEEVLGGQIGGTTSAPIYFETWYPLDAGDVVTTSLGTNSIVTMYTFDMKGL